MRVQRYKKMAEYANISATFLLFMLFFCNLPYLRAVLHEVRPYSGWGLRIELLPFQRGDSLLEGGNLFERVALLLALHGNYGLGGMGNKLLVAELLAH